VEFNLRFWGDAFVNVDAESKPKAIIWQLIGGMVKDAHLLGNGNLPEESGVCSAFRVVKQRDSVHAIPHSRQLNGKTKGLRGNSGKGKVRAPYAIPWESLLLLLPND